MKLANILTVWILVTFGGHTHATAEWEQLNEEVGSLYQQGEYSRATAVAKKALQTAEQTLDPNHPDVATSLNSLALLYTAQAQYTQAEPLLKRSLAIFEKAGAESAEMATTLNNLAMLYRSQE